MLQTCEAFTLRTYPFAEANRIVVFLCRDLGRIRAVAYGARKSRSRFGSALEQLSLVRLTFRRREGQELAVVESCEVIRPSPAYQLGFEQNLYLGYFTELVTEFSWEHVSSERVFRLVGAVIDASDKVDMQLLARYFEFWMLRLEGVLPSLDQLLPGELASRTVMFLQKPPSSLVGWTFLDDDMEKLEKVAANLIECHLEKPLKARRMLREML